MATFTPYQVDYSVKNAAKNLGFSKKRVAFKFGFADDKALQEGRNGPACRGSEHELTFVWSLGSGKRHLQLDGKDVHFSESGQNGWTVDHTWQHSFQLHDKATKRVYRFNFVSQPVNKERPDVRPFDLVVGGLSYFQFNPIYELGTPKMIAMPVVDGSAHRAASPISAEERRQLAAAKLASLQDLRQSQKPNNDTSSHASGMKHDEVSLINFDDDQPPPPSVPQPHPYGQQRPTSSGGQYSQYFASSVTMEPSIAENVPAPGSTVYGTNPYGAPAPPQPNTTANPYGFPVGNQQQPSPYAAAPAPYGGPPQPPAGALPPSQASMQAGFQAPPPNNSGYPPAGPSSYQASGYPPSGAAAPFAPPPQPQQPAPAYQPYGGTNPPGAPYQQQPQQPAYGQQQQGMSMQQQPQQQQPYNNYSLTSPSAQSQFSYGSAPSFAQPPPQQPQTQYQQPPQQNAPQYPYSQQGR